MACTAGCGPRMSSPCRVARASAVSRSRASASSTPRRRLAGLPVIAGSSGGAPEAVVADDDGVSGLVVDGSSAAEVAAAIGALLTLSDQERRAMGERGRRLALARHAPQVARTRYRELLRRAAGV